MDTSVRRKSRRQIARSLFPDSADNVSIPDACVSAPSRIGDGDIQQRRDPYERFYAALRGLREAFHRIGQFDDANAKLDEFCKLLALKVLDGRHPVASGSNRLGLAHLRTLAREKYGDEGRLASALHDVYADLTLRFPEEMAAFGTRNGLNLSPEDDAFAAALIPVLEALPRIAENNERSWSFDGVNEAFGHFIQDSFRNRKEDAQYMTPPEVVSPIVAIAIRDLVAECGGRTPKRPYLVADPTCGVGSFLAAVYRQALHIPLANGALADHLHLFGQDKVERMVRLACVNLQIFAGVDATLRQGNSVVPPGTLSDIHGEVDLILTNPPFGATFDSRELLEQSKDNQLPTLHALARRHALPKAIDSEYVLLDRELSLLKAGGRLMMVVPDHVVSAGGFSEAFRLALQQTGDLVAVFDLPTETFAQAGTRTKTSVVYLRRKSTKPKDGRASHVFMATSVDLGFRVVSRSGATVKRIVGPNDMETIASVYKSFRQSHSSAADIDCLSHEPSIAAVAADRLLNNRWTAGFYQTERLRALQQIEVGCAGEFEGKRLIDLVELDPRGNERVLADEHNRCISVLHVREDGCIDLRAVDAYRPTTPGTRCMSGDVLLAKINPRIPRVCVVPETPWQLGCSSEFAVMRPAENSLNSWALFLLLRSETVQAQIRTLTSGTSSSHNRIKDRDLAAIVVPVPKQGTQAVVELENAARELELATKQQYAAARSMRSCLQRIHELIGERHSG
jgi:type I restriction-modification system DNA methylase subunit